MFAVKTVLCIFICNLLLDYIHTSPPDSLRQVSVLYRHGDRSPVTIYPKDINKESVWPDGLGWLTNIGKVQHYELGQYLKQRYDGFLNTSHYKHEEILVQSSGVERCLMSAYCNLAGLFPPYGDQKWNEGIPWQPIPVQTSPVKTDNKLAEEASCPRFNQLLQEVLNSSEIKKEEEENKDFYAMVEANSGIKQESIADIWQVIDTLVCEKAHNLTWNDWVTPSVWSKMLVLKALSFDIYFAYPEMVKLKGGPLLKEIIHNMNTSTFPGGIKFYMYSAHDITVASLLSAMMVYNKIPPIYRSLVMVELHQINNVSEVKIFYKNETSRDPYELFLPGCGSPCTLEQFQELTKDYVPNDWTAECVAKTMFSPSATLTPASWIALTVGIGLCVAIAIAIIVMTVKMHKIRSANYTKI